ncbi:PfkB family carbohydrate kinase [Roseiconus nitratireducens]|nr:PfkB family carbohydrate kinase [Roseiconus nitratireducens]
MPNENESHANDARPIIIIGESLADEFDDGSQVVGGAPMNVAWNLTGLGLAPLFLTAVGKDALGEQITDGARNWGMRMEGFQHIDDKPTGRVKVTMDDNEPSYEILADQAYDHLSVDRLPELPSAKPILYHGSLCFRSATTRNTIESVRRRVKDWQGTIFLDINLRKKQFKEEWLPSLLGGLDVLKCNVNELEELSPSGTIERNRESITAAAKEFLQRWSIGECWLTDGANGAHWVSAKGDTEFVSTPSIRQEDFEDTVGAGDAFASIVLRGLATGQTAVQTLETAVEFAARICQMRGATSEDRHVYDLSNT